FYEQAYSNDAKVRIKVIEKDVIHDEDAAARLGLDPEDELICLKRLRYVDDVLSRYSVI
ncbi:GntR family transcriptional regulator, partial [Bifidobacteriaceae bacterium WP022]